MIIKNIARALKRFTKRLFKKLASYIVNRKINSQSKASISILKFSDSLPLHKQIYYLSFYLNPILDKVKLIKVRGISSKELNRLKNFNYETLDFLSSESKVINSFLDKLKKRSTINSLSLINLSSPSYNIGFNYNLDVYQNKNATSEMLNLSNRFFSQKKIVEESKKRYLNNVVTKEKSEKILLLGSGPSVDSFDFSNYSDHDIMICNSLVKSKKIKNLENIKYILFGDPIFHSGPSKYAGVFRETLIKNYMNKEISIFTPSRDYLIYKHYLPKKLFDKIHFFEIRQEFFNKDLDRSFHVNATQNILTLAMLPVAMNNYEKIFFAGFDGNSDIKKNYYWSHSKKYQFENELTDIKKIHPGFFKIDFDEYSEDHNKVLGKIIKSYPDILFQNLTESSIDALKDIT